MKTNEDMQRLPFFLIDLMKSVLNDEVGVADKADVLLFEIWRQIVNCNAQGEPNADLEYLYETTQWLLKDVIEIKSKESTKVNIADFIEMYCGRIPANMLERLNSLLNRGLTEVELTNEDLEVISKIN